jgi:hypothetical protein
LIYVYEMVLYEYTTYHYIEENAYEVY